MRKHMMRVAETALRVANCDLRTTVSLWNMYVNQALDHCGERL